eukprot:GHUV01034533.1.p1 GENE.GHUV01034533.1~~GHUV01034533.1.p1  ORF type:complete len:281 (-),score=47.81 GHUV01034533.1:327-1169(-)
MSAHHAANGADVQPRDKYHTPYCCICIIYTMSDVRSMQNADMPQCKMFAAMETKHSRLALNCVPDSEVYGEQCADLLFACDDGMPGSLFWALSGRCWFITCFSTLQMNDDRTAPMTAQAANSLCCHTRTPNTAAETVHFVDSLIADRTCVCMLLVAAAGDPTPSSGILSLLPACSAGMATVTSEVDCNLHMSSNTTITTQASGVVVLRAALREPSHLLAIFPLRERLERCCKAAVALPHGNWCSIIGAQQNGAEQVRWQCVLAQALVLLALAQALPYKAM